MIAPRCAPVARMAMTLREREMIKNKWMTCTSLVALWASLGSVPALAQGAEPTAGQAAASGTGLEEIVFTAGRVSERQQRVPLTVTAISPKTLANRNVQAV